MCIDYRALNKLTVRNRYPLPRIDECLEQLSGAKVFTSLDLKSGYHQVRLREEDKPKTAFNTRYGQYQFRVLPFGLTNAPPTFQAMMNRVLGDFLDKFVMVYLDDILIYSKDMQEHKRHVKMVLDKLREHKFFLNRGKCEFGVEELIFVGYRITKDGILPDQAKVKTIQEWPVPTNVQEVRQFLGTTAYYRRFIKNYAHVAAPMTNLTQGSGPKKRSIVWTVECQEAFDKLKQELTNAPLLMSPVIDKPFKVYTDASDYACGAV
ncbi:hypothetical protein, partial, partial [Absidia glauca]